MKKNDNKKRIKLIDSFNYAVNGIITAVGTERNMKIHYATAIIVLTLSLFFDLSRVEFMILLLTISLVIVSELINTAIEKTIDMITEEYHPIAKIVKDISAGAVLIAAVNSVIVGYLLFFEKLDSLGNILLLKIRNSSTHMTIIAIMLVLIFTIGFKMLFYKKRGGTHFQGGAVSGHSALGFCIATIIATMTTNTMATALSYILALLIAESRVEGGIHTTGEVVAGGVLGLLVGILIFQIIS
ncbi:MAG: phosphatase PAP2 family protein [Tissierellia bacterium]|nr:phosphatase PAP2 family protein [Tissierellia bacterium]